MVADALATAAFVLGPVDGVHLLERHGVDGLLVTPALERFTTRGMRAEYLIERRTPPNSST
jgi:thiamine biosynthesis lipoprotein ApbE